MKNKYMKYTDKLQDLIDLEYPSQQLFKELLQTKFLCPISIDDHQILIQRADNVHEI